ncbi:MAG TPA: hypothetical protein VF532_12250 [Candidatus Angelobacter sp.]
MKRGFLAGCFLVSFCWIPGVAPEDHPVTAIREEQQVVVDGVTETWRLQWSAAPKPYCGAKEYDVALTCPCMGFAYGEAGDLYLVRLRSGEQIDRLHLTPFFTEVEPAVVQRWPVDDKHDFKLAERKDFAAVVSRRAIAQVMRLADYDHDGLRSEFYLQTESAPCGKSVGVVIGLSRSNARLHVFGAASSPSKPLYLQKREWEALRDATSGPVNVVDWHCGDHGAYTQTELQLQWSAKGIEGLRLEYSCPSKNEKRQLIKEEPL